MKPLSQLIDELNWYDFLNKIKKILKGLSSSQGIDQTLEQTVNNGDTVVGVSGTTRIVNTGGDVVVTNPDQTIQATLQYDVLELINQTNGDYAGFYAGSLQMNDVSGNVVLITPAYIALQNISLKAPGTVGGDVFFQDRAGTIAFLDDIGGLKYICIQDYYQEYFTDKASALTCLSNFSLPEPINSFYNSDTKEFYFIYNTGYLEDIFVNWNSSTEEAFGYNNHVSIQDESGFIYGFAGNAFHHNNKHEYANPNILKVGVFSDDNALADCHSDFIIEQNYVSGNQFAGGADGNITIGLGQYPGGKAFHVYSGSNGNKLTIKNLQTIGIDTQFCSGVSNTRIDLLHVDSAIVFDAYSFSSTDPIALHIPAFDIGLTSANYLQLVTNITNTDSVIIRD